MPAPSPAITAAIRAIVGESDLADERLARVIALARDAHVLVRAIAAAYRVVAEAPWDDLSETIRAAILQRAADTAEGVAIAAARGLDVAGRCRAARKQRVPLWMMRNMSAAFFAALDPNVWNALDVDRQRRWRQALARMPGVSSSVRLVSIRKHWR